VNVSTRHTLAIVDRYPVDGKPCDETRRIPEGTSTFARGFLCTRRRLGTIGNYVWFSERASARRVLSALGRHHRDSVFEGGNGMATNPRQPEREAGQIAEEATRRTTEQVTQAARTMAATGEQTARAGAEAVRQGSETVRNARESSNQIATQVTDRSLDWMSRTFGLSANGGQDLLQQSSRNIGIILETSTALATGMQSVSREWMSFAQKRIQQNFDRIDSLMNSRTPHELIVAQTDLVRDNLEDLLQNSRRISEMAARMTEEATRKMGEASLAHR
jgi:phasin family protein